MPQIFVSYRREDTAGVAGRLAADLASRFGRRNVFIDIDRIAPGADFEVRIDEALRSCQVAFVLIGARWLTATTETGGRRIDKPSDFVRREVIAALSRSDLELVPVLVDGARMPEAQKLPEDLHRLVKLNALELSNTRWSFDVGRVCRTARRHDPWWKRPLSWHPRPRAAVELAAVAALAAGGIAALESSSGATSSAPNFASARQAVATREGLLAGNAPHPGLCGDLSPRGSGAGITVSDVWALYGADCASALNLVTHVIQQGKPTALWRCSYAPQNSFSSNSKPREPSICVDGVKVVGWYGEAP